MPFWKGFPPFFYINNPFFLRFFSSKFVWLYSLNTRCNYAKLIGTQSAFHHLRRQSFYRWCFGLCRFTANRKNPNLQRSGKTNSSSYGVIDNLTFAHIGIQLKYVNDAATDPLYSGAFNFVNGSSSTGTEYVYDSNGSLVHDYNK